MYHPMTQKTGMQAQGYENGGDLQASRAGDAALDLGGTALRAESTGVLH